MRILPFLAVAGLLAASASAQNIRSCGSGPGTLVQGTDAAGASSSLCVPVMSIISGTPWFYVAPASGSITNSTTAVTLAPAVAGQRNYITDIQISHGVLTSAGEIVIRDGAGGTVIWRALDGTTQLPGGSVSIRFPTPLRSSPGNLLEFATLTASGSGTHYVNAQGFIAP